MDIFKSTHTNNASPHFGIHYFEDTLHYRELDLLSWLPEMSSMDITWCTLLSDTERAIPENFIAGLIQAGISTNVRFNFTFKDIPSISEIAPLVQAYASWGVNSVQFFDRPNEKSSWMAADWTNQDMIGKYLDQLLPFIRLANDYGLKTILPPLQPGGSYWDTIFLRSLLTMIIDRGEENLFDQLILSVYAWTGKHSLNWGAGGSSNWPAARPYFSPPDVEDQRGFRIFDWYNEICRDVTGIELPVVLHHCGVPADPFLPHPILFSEDDQIACNKDIYNLIHPDVSQSENKILPLPSNILACNFWVLSATKEDAWCAQAWFNENGSPTSLGKAMQQRILTGIKSPQKRNSTSPAKRNIPAPPPVQQQVTVNRNKTAHVPKSNGKHALENYILLPTSDLSLSAFFLDAMNPYIKEFQPTFGFSTDEAKVAHQVILVGGEHTFEKSVYSELQKAGCIVRRITGDGTEIATILAER
ncbi:MAG: hypothetical protein JEZ00_13890 [Anaerolineaceae bacterium]|nr:hypothetical protein [Anaerolineaceae bacterium]